MSSAHDHWVTFLAHQGARVADGCIRDFGFPEAEAAATARGGIVAPLDRFGVLAIAGDDARDFLHTQLSCDVQSLPDDRAAWGCYCTPKGRVLANFLLWCAPDGFRMLLPAVLVAGIQKRLQMFILRAKVKLAERTGDEMVLGLSGSEASAAVARITGPLPQAEMGVAYRDGVTAIAVGRARVIVVASAYRAQKIWPQLSGALKPVGPDRWAWLDIIDGLPWIEPATQDELVPQMANLELIGAINFRKGCYPGQEIVARTQYLGTPKRRLALAHVAGERAPIEGESLIVEGDLEQSAGTVVNAAPAPGGGFDLLAVVQTAYRERPLRLGAPDGPPVDLRALPYSVP